jgi:hypothetical protein
MIKSRFCTPIFTAVLLVVINGINQIDAKEFINEEFNIKFDYPDEWKSLKPEKANFGIDYDKKPIAIFYPDPNPAVEFNFVSLTVYTNMANLDQFEKTIRKELLTDEEAKQDILDIKKYKLNSGVLFVLIDTLYTPILTGVMSQFTAPSDERNYILFHKDNIGYNIAFSMPKEIENKYANNIHTIMNQIQGNITS